MGKSVQELSFPPERLIVLLIRGDEKLVPKGSTVFQAGDTILLAGDVLLINDMDGDSLT